MIIICFKKSLYESDKEIRASALRALRYFLNTREDIHLFSSLSIPTLVIRILDINYDESAYDDRVQALKVKRPKFFYSCIFFSGKPLVHRI